MTMREQIALAIHGEMVAVIADDREPETRCFAAADAVLDAMREPTPEMVEAGKFPAEWFYGPAAIFKAMIDAAKGELI